MSVKYTWKIVRIKITNTDSFQDAVVNVYWQKTGYDDVLGVTGSFEGATPFDADQIDPNNFTALNQLTEDMVLGWVKNVVTGDYADHVDAQIQNDINNKAGLETLIKEKDLPWKAE